LSDLLTLQGLMDIGKIKNGDTVVISGAAGSVGIVSDIVDSESMLILTRHGSVYLSEQRLARHSTRHSSQPERSSHHHRRYPCQM
jgi:hypothetical protein